MNLPIPISAKCGVREAIKFLNVKGNKPTDIHRQLIEVYGNDIRMDINRVWKWCREFSTGRTEIHDQGRSGRLLTSDVTIVKIKEKLREDRKVTINELSFFIRLSLFYLHAIFLQSSQSSRQKSTAGHFFLRRESWYDPLKIHDTISAHFLCPCLCCFRTLLLTDDEYLWAYSLLHSNILSARVLRTSRRSE